MGCLGLVLAALLALGVPASIARSSLIGAYLVIAALAAAAVAIVVWATRRRQPLPAGAGNRLPTALARIGALTVAYVVIVTLVHTTA